jgi:ribonuclease D
VTRDLARLAREAGRLAIDTEFMSEGRYQALLCLAQVAVPDPSSAEGARTEVLDPLGDGLDPRPVAAVLADPGIEVVVHAGRQDVAILRRSWRTEIRNVFDTQVAAGFIGHGTQESYESLVRRLLGVSLPKGEGFTRWNRRPLTKAQLEYARADASSLLALGDAIEERLAQAGRLDWVREECRALEDASDERDPDRIYARLPRVARLRPRQRAVARELVAWREETARELDRPPGSVLPDHVLVEVARKEPATRGSLEDVRGLPAATLHRRHRELLAAVARGRERPTPPAPSEPRFPTEAGDAPLVALGQALVRHRSLETGVAAELIATQTELAQVVAALRAGEREPAARVLGGWRRELVGAELLELLAGRRVLHVGPSGRLEVRPR